MKQKLNECDRQLSSLNRILDLEKQGLQAHYIAIKSSKGQIALPRGSERKRKNMHDDWDDDLVDLDASDEEVGTHELNVVMKNHGSWDNYIKDLKLEVKMELINMTKYKSELKNFEDQVSTLINEIKSSPFTILGC
ncbi:MAG: hypothetical protein HAW67_06305 [Endozoicomonadaceae bacterium]|nr:hypothetical protein [Endozoicomonadaceae bacterium]